MTASSAGSLIQKSTIVRANSTVKARAVRLAFGVLERRAPGLGSVWAERLWCTIPSAKKPRPVIAEPGTVVTLALHAPTPAPGRGAAPTFVAEAWGTDGPVVYLLHGWGGYRGQLGAFVAPLTAAGYRVVALDAPSHGESAPGSFGRGRSLITEFIAALDAATREFGPAHGVVAHSLGGGAAALAVLDHVDGLDGVPVGRLVLVAPMPDPNAYAQLFAATLGFGDRIRTGLLRRLERRVGRPMTDFDAVTRARTAAESRDAAGDADPAPPLLVVHDREDKEIPYGLGRAIAAAWQGAELLSTKGLGHRRILRDPEVVRTAVDFLGAVQVQGAAPAGRRSSAA